MKVCVCMGIWGWEGEMVRAVALLSSLLCLSEDDVESPLAHSG